MISPEITTRIIDGQEELFVDVAHNFFSPMHRRLETEGKLLHDLANTFVVEHSIKYKSLVKKNIKQYAHGGRQGIGWDPINDISTWLSSQNLEGLAYKMERLKVVLLDIEINGYDMETTTPILVRWSGGILQFANGFHRASWLYHLGRPIPARIVQKSFLPYRL